MTDTDALKERIARALFEKHETDITWDATLDFPAMRSQYLDDAAAVLPIVAEEVRKAKAEAWDEAASHAENKSWLTNFRADDLRTANPYEEERR